MSGALAAVLGAVHRSSGSTRAGLTRATGLNRSTVGAAVGELVQLGLVAEGGAVRGDGPGRPSPVVAPTSRAVAFAVNPEVDAITVTAVGLGGRVLGSERLPTGSIPPPERAARLAAEGIDRLRERLPRDRQEVGTGAAVPGLVRAADGLVRLAPHLEWRSAPFGALVADATGLPATSANDATCGAVAERVFGAGRGVDDLVHLNGGASGVGGGVITGGRMLSGASGYAGELGHTPVGGRARCHCGAVGCLETVVGRRELLAVTGLAAADEDRLGDALAASRDPAVRAEVERQTDALAVALRTAVNVLDPTLVVLGGFLASLDVAAHDRLVAAVSSSALPGPRDDVRIVRAALGSRRLAIGAAELAFASLLADPR